MIDFDHVIAELGGTGRYQVCLVLMLLYWSMSSGYNMISPVFINYVSDYRCEVSAIANCTAEMDEVDILNLTTPISPDGKYERCKRYQNRNISICINICDCIDHESDVIPCDEGYHYDTSMFTNTVVSEFDLVCEQAYLDSLVQSIYMVGFLIGSFVFGYTSDRWGRRMTIGISSFLSLATHIGCTFVQTYWLFIVCRVLIGLFVAGPFFTGFVYAQEIVSDKWRTLVGVSSQIGSAVGYMILSGIAYNWRNWHEIQFAIAVILMPATLFLFVIPESPRWLFAHGKDERAKEISRLIAKRNGVEIDETTIWKEHENVDHSPKHESPVQTDKDVKDESYSTLDLFKTPGIRTTTFLSMFIWFVNGFVYLGISLNVGTLSGDIFINNVLGGVVDIAGNLVVALFMNLTGRRPMLIFMFCLSGIGLISSTVVTEFAASNQALETFSVVLALAAKLGISGSFGATFNYTSELFPTVIRSNAIGICNIAATIGGAVAPFLLTLQTSISWLPNVVFGVTTSLAAVLMICLPETNNKHLLENIEEAEDFYAKNKFSLKSSSRSFPSSTSVFTIYTNERVDEDEKGSKL